MDADSVVSELKARSIVSPMLALRDVLLAFANDYPSLRQWPSNLSPRRKWLSTEAKAAVERALPESSGLIVKLSGGMTTAAETPWIGIRRADLAASFMSGVYIVYLFPGDRKRVILGMMLGVTQPAESKTSLKASSRDTSLLRDRAEGYFEILQPPEALSQRRVYLNANYITTRQYEAGFICGRTYYVEAFADEAMLLRDLDEVVALYQTLSSNEGALNTATKTFASKPIDQHRKRSDHRHIATETDLDAARQARERASKTHEAVVLAVVAAASKAKAGSAEDNPHIDVIVNSRFLVEVKSTKDNELRQMRSAVAQLLFYRFLYRDRYHEPVLIAAFSQPPSPSASSIVEFIEYVGIAVVWRDGKRFSGTAYAREVAAWLFSEPHS